jgi:hypothetical protein
MRRVLCGSIFSYMLHFIYPASKVLILLVGIVKCPGIAGRWSAIAVVRGERRCWRDLEDQTLAWRGVAGRWPGPAGRAGLAGRSGAP